jgi:hypothetical protein
MLATEWEPIEKNWGDLAHQEVMTTFDGQLKTRAVALCVWYLSVQPEVTPYEMETLARRDPDIEKRADGAKINPYSVRQARKILVGDTGAKPKNGRCSSDRRRVVRKKKAMATALAKLDTELVDRLHGSAEVIDNYLHISTEMAMLQASFAKTHRALLQIPHEHAIELAGIEPSVAHVLAREGLLSPPAEELTAIWPDDAGGDKNPSEPVN